MKSEKWVSVTLSKDVVEQLRLLAHPGQSISGVIQELLNKVSVRVVEAVAKMHFPEV